MASRWPQTVAVGTLVIGGVALLTLAGHISINEVNSLASCSFDQDLCGWLQDDTDRFDWTRNIGSTSTGQTGPDIDHSTNGNKFYMFIETSAPRLPGDFARLISPVIDTWNHNYLCLHVWYYAYGNSLGSLKVSVNEQVYKNETQVLFFDDNLVSKQQWVPLTQVIKPEGPFTIAVEGTVGASYTGDIAIDDISFTAAVNGSCA